jgi:prevent-host-death family protein
LTNLFYVLKYVQNNGLNYVIIIVQKVILESWLAMLRTTNVSTLRTDLSSFLSGLEDGPVLVLSHSKPTAVLVDPELFESLVEKVELLEDLIDGRRAISEYHEDPNSVVEAEEVFKRLGY